MSTAQAVENHSAGGNPSPAQDPGKLLETMKRACRSKGAPPYQARMVPLADLGRAVLAHKDDIARAISADFGHRSPHESFVADVFVTHGAIRHARTHLHEWMETEPRDVAWTFLPGRAEVVKQPLGVVGIIS